MPRSLRAFGIALTGSRKDRLNGRDSSQPGNTYGLALDQTKIPGSWARMVGGRREARNIAAGELGGLDVVPGPVNFDLPPRASSETVSRTISSRMAPNRDRA